MMIATALSQLGDAQSASMQLRTLISDIPAYAELTEAGRTAMVVEGRVALARLLARLRDWAGVLDEAREVARIMPGHAEAMLLGVQARILLLSESDESSARDAAAWQEIDQALTKLDQATGGAVQVKMLALQAAMRQGKLAEAQKILEQI
jgi:hypothetical protein